MSDVVYHPAEPDNHSDNGRGAYPAQPARKDEDPGPYLHSADLGSAALDATLSMFRLENGSARLCARCRDGEALAVTIETLSKSGKTEALFTVTDMSPGVARGASDAVSGASSEAADAIRFLAAAQRRGECRVSYEIAPPRRTTHGEGGGVLMQTTTAPASLEELARGARRSRTALIGSDGTLLDLDLVSGGDSPARCEILLVNRNGEHLRYALDDENAGKLGKLAFTLIEAYIAGGAHATAESLEEMFRPPSAEPEEPAWEPEEDEEYETYAEQDDEPAVAEVFTGKSREHELPSGSRVGYWLDGSRLEFEICSGQRWSDRVIYKIEIDPMQANVERKIDYVFERLISGSPEQQAKAIKALATFGDWGATFQNGSRQHEPLDELKDHFREIDVEGALWRHFPETDGDEIELELLNGRQHGILSVPDRALHELSTICFLLDTRGEGEIRLSNGMGGALAFRLPPLEEEEGTFGRRQLLKGYLDLFLESPARLVDELCEDAGSPRATNMKFPYDSTTHRGYAEVGELLEKQLAAYSSNNDAVQLPSIRDLGGGRFEVDLAPPRRRCYGMRIEVDTEGPARVTLERERPLGLMRLLGSTESMSFPLRGNGIDPVQMFRKFGPLCDVMGGERAHAVLVDYLRKKSGYDATLPGRARSLWRSLFG